MQKKTISILIPCRNEEKYIAACLDSVLASNYPAELTEIFVIDGMSTDSTVEIIKKYTKKNQNIYLLFNEKQNAPAAINLGIKSSKSDYIIRIDAHSEFQKNYFSTLIYYAEKLNADNVGGVVENLPADDSLNAKAIAIAMGHPFGVGNSHFRIGSNEIKKVDTVPFGCFKRDIFEKIGLFDEDLPRAEDDEFNARINKNGGSVYIIPEVRIKYFTRDSFLKLFKMFYQYGLFKPLANKKIGYAYSIRQFAPVVFVIGLIMSPLFLFIYPLNLIFYIIMVLYLSAGIVTGITKVSNINETALIFLMPVTFFIMHFSYGIGYLKGIFDFLIMGKHSKIVDITR